MAGDKDDWWGGGYKPAAWEKPKCTCGVSITMGKEDHWHFHSDYCEIYKKGKEDEETTSKKKN